MTTIDKNNWDRYYGTDKIENGYKPFYESYFESIRQKNIKLLEIGVQKGGSLNLWKDYFPTSQIHGVDIVTQFKFSYVHQGIQIHTPVDAGSRKDLSKLIDNIGGDFDIIIDDGSHCMYDHQVSLGFLFKYLKPGGIYVIEDLSCQDFVHNFNTAIGMNRRRSKSATKEVYGKNPKGETMYLSMRGLKPIIHTNKKIPGRVILHNDYGYAFDVKNNTIDMIKNFNESGLINSKYMISREKTYLSENIEKVELCDTNVILKDSKKPQQIVFFVKKEVDSE